MGDLGGLVGFISGFLLGGALFGMCSTQNEQFYINEGQKRALPTHCTQMDINNDEIPDLILTNNQDNPIDYIFLGQSDGTYKRFEDVEQSELSQTLNSHKNYRAKVRRELFKRYNEGKNQQGDAP